ncbi:MAG: crossover junction endodeoxyribonuclease RuvC [Chitinophagales bacterium]|nr:crossover junction endodeoxyribonuclease RuvC [Chitinophagales bacterium]
MNLSSKIILGIDPGTIIMGYGLISVQKSDFKVISLGAIQIKEKDQVLRLKTIHSKIIQLIKTHLPDECAIEAPFFGKNAQSMLKLGRAQGVCMAAAISMDIPVTEYSPKKIKQSITGNGNASKEQVAAMLQSLCKFNRMPKHLDATDGLATAVCHHFQSTSISPAGKFKSWKDFISKNPHRIQ